MANKRIKDLSTTAAVTASDDFIAVDGATNGTRKLDAYSPTFGGNLTVNGTGTHSFNGPVSITGTTASNLLRLTKSGAGSKTFGIDNALDFRIYADNGSTQLFKLTDSGDTTITGNLTVSGTGTSSVAGNLFVGTTTAAASGARLQAQLTGTDGTVSTLLSLRKNTNAAGTGVAIDFTPESTDNPLAKLSAVRTSLNNGYTDFRFSTWNGSALVEQLRLVGQTGNLLIGTTTDSGNGKLQLATHTTSAGGIGFGTDVSLYRNAANQVSFIGGGSAPIGFALASGNPYLFGGASSSFIRFNSGGQIDIITATASSLTLQTNFTTALTLDSGQNATFAGTIAIGQYTTAGAPAYAKGKLYFDVTLNKLRVGGATGWETVTSV